MPTKKISELAKVNSVNDADLLLVETSNGTRAIKKSDIIPAPSTNLSDFVEDTTHRLVTDTEKETWHNKQEKIVKDSIALTATGWTGEEVFTQTVTISGTTANSKIDLQADSEVLLQLINDSVSALYVKNDNGVCTAYAVGAAPTVDITVQVTITEVG